MGDFVLKRFEVEGLNCCFADIPLLNGTRKQPLADVIRQLADKDGRFRYELESRNGMACRISRLVWSAESDQKLTPGSDQFYELESSANSHTRTEFRYMISDQFGQIIETGFDKNRPIFSSSGPTLENGFSVKIDLVAISLPHSNHSPLLARQANRNYSWIQDSDLILDLQ